MMIDTEFSLKPPPDMEEEEEERCVKRWNEGYEFEPYDDDFPVVMKPVSNCSVPVDGKFAYIELPKEKEWLNLFLKTIERLTPRQLLQSKYSVFTWILYKKNGQLQFAASPVRSIFEVGTLHRNIAQAVGANTIHGAGEIKKARDGLYYNFISGTYMVPWIRKKDRTCTLAEMEEYITPKLQEFFPGILLRKSESTFITSSFTPVTMEELKLYKDAHFTVCIHDSQDTCKKLQGSCLKT